MYGHCDAFDVIYTQVGENQWQATVPPEAGTYVLEFTYTIPPEIFIRRVMIYVG